jgi:hypothetical protein
MPSPPKKSKPTPPPKEPSFAYTSLPAEIRLMILHHALTPATGPQTTISTHPRSKNFPKPRAEPWLPPFYGPQQTQWHARRGLLQASSGLRAETLQVLYGSFTFFARMPMGWEFDGKRRFRRWLKALGSEEDVERVRRVIFRVEWPAVRRSGGMEWFKGRTEVEVKVFRGQGRVRVKVEVVKALWVQKGEEAPWLHLEDVEETIKRFLRSKKADGVVGLGRKEWMEVWRKVKGVMRLQDFY